MEYTWKIMRSPKLRKLVRYVLAGTTAAAGNIGILFVLVEYFHIYYLAASVLSYLGALGLGFTLQKFWTFRDHSTHKTHFQLFLYMGVTTMNLGINTTLMYFFVSVLGIWYIAAQVLAGGAIAVTGYIAYQGFVFKETVRPEKS